MCQNQLLAPTQLRDRCRAMHETLREFLQRWIMAALRMMQNRRTLITPLHAGCETLRRFGESDPCPFSRATHQCPGPRSESWREFHSTSLSPLYPPLYSIHKGVRSSLCPTNLISSPVCLFVCLICTPFIPLNFAAADICFA